MLNTLNKKFTCEEVGEYEFIKTDRVAFRVEGGLSYPDTGSIGWRRNAPFVSNEVGSKDNIRVYDERLNAHIYLQKVVAVKGDTDLVRVQFPREDGHLFCNIVSWYDGGKCGDFIRYNMETKHSDDTITLRATRGEEKVYKLRVWASEMYRIMSIVRID